MAFQYLLRTADGQTFTADSHAECVALLKKLKQQFPEQEIEVQADVIDAAGAAEKRREGIVK